MTTVNWERLSGEAVEELAAALLVLSKPHGNQVTPSRGDKGIDIRIWTETGWEIYQVKRYHRPLTSRQAKDVEASWATFVAESLPSMQVASWNLVLPWNPSQERLRWLESLAAGYDFAVNWIGRTQLDVLAADNPRIVSYYHGDGADRVQELMAQALSGGSLPPGDVAGEQLLIAVAERYRALTTTLDEVDPFYRYEIEIRPGPLTDDWSSQIQPADDASAYVLYRQVNDDHHLVTRVIARSVLSAVLRPIRHSMHLNVSDPTNRENVERFRRYGIPFSDVPAITVSSTGPPGTTMPPESSAVVSMALNRQAKAPDLEVRVLNSSGERLARLALVDVELSHGDIGKGMRIAGWDSSHSVSVEMLMSEDDAPDTLTMSTTSVSGKPATRVLDAVEFAAVVEDGSQVQLAFNAGMPIGAAWPIKGFATEHRQLWADVVKALTEIQAHTYSVVRVPETLTQDLVRQIKRVARLIRGEVLQESWTETVLTVTHPDALDRPEFAVAVQRRLAIELEGELIELDRVELIHSPRAHFDATNGPAAVGDDVRIVFDEAPTTRAAIYSPSASPDRDDSA